MIVYATGFDAMTGALSRIDVRGRNAMSLGEFWASEGPLSYLGLAVAGFPNLFTIQGPGGPSPASNFVAALEQHVEWISDCITYLRDNGFRTIEALATAQQEWIDHATSLVARPCWFTRLATLGTTVAMCPARSGCTWAIPVESPNIGAAATKSPPADTPVSSWLNWFKVSGMAKALSGLGSAKDVARELGMVLPRTVAGLNESTGWVPASPRAVRQFGEVMLDELVLSGFSLLGGNLTKMCGRWTRARRRPRSCRRWASTARTPTQNRCR